tara:strand:- start:469 stop:744 length:276 start_codon:yes stop_codon:yes gene_type:complete
MNTIFIARGSHRASDDALTLRGRAGQPATASRPKGSPLKATATAASHRRFNNQLLENMLHLADLVVMAGSLTPVPIPNTAVKYPSANGTLS